MDKSFVTMEQKMCPVCGKTHDSGALLLDKRMRNQFDVKTTTGYDFCKDCKKKKDEGYLALVVCDPEKTKIDNNTVKMQDAYRTGELIHVKKEVAKKLFKNLDLEHNDFVFIDSALADKLKKMVKKKKR